LPLAPVREHLDDLEVVVVAEDLEPKARVSMVVVRRLVDAVHEGNTHDQAAGRPQDPCDLADRSVGMRHVLKNICEYSRVVGLVVEGQRLSEIRHEVEVVGRVC